MIGLSEITSSTHREKSFHIPLFMVCEPKPTTRMPQLWHTADSTNARPSPSQSFQSPLDVWAEINAYSSTKATACLPYHTITTPRDVSSFAGPPQRRTANFTNVCMSLCHESRRIAFFHPVITMKTSGGVLEVLGPVLTRMPPRLSSPFSPTACKMSQTLSAWEMMLPQR